MRSTSATVTYAWSLKYNVSVNTAGITTTCTKKTLLKRLQEVWPKQQHSGCWLTPIATAINPSQYFTCTINDQQTYLEIHTIRQASSTGNTRIFGDELVSVVNTKKRIRMKIQRIPWYYLNFHQVVDLLRQLRLFFLIVNSNKSLSKRTRLQQLNLTLKHLVF